MVPSARVGWFAGAFEMVRVGKVAWGTGAEVIWFLWKMW